MEVFEVTRQRKSIRQFSKDTVKKQDLLKSAEAARMSATSVHQQSRKFTMLHKQALIKKLDRAFPTDTICWDAGRRSISKRSKRKNSLYG